MFESFFSIQRKKSGYDVAADFINGLNQRDAGQNGTRSRDDVFDDVPPGDDSQKKYKNQKKDESKDAGDEND
jgi:hypothetical protein